MAGQRSQSPPASWSFSSFSIVKSSAPLNGESCSTLSSSSRRSSSCNTPPTPQFHAVECAFRGIFYVLETSGIPHDRIQELHQLESRQEYSKLLQKAERYVEKLACHRAPGGGDDASNDHHCSIDLEAVTALIAAAWESLRVYSRDRFRSSQKAYSRYQNKQWEEFIVSQRLSDREQLRRQIRHEVAGDRNANEATALKCGLAQATRLVRECEKGIRLHQEWIRYLRVVQRQCAGKRASN